MLSAEAEQRLNLTSPVKSKHFVGIFILCHRMRGREVVSEHLWEMPCGLLLSLPQAPALPAGGNALIDGTGLINGKNWAVSEVSV